MLPARPSRERLVSAQGGRGSSPKVTNKQQQLRILYCVSVCTYGEDYLLVSSHTVIGSGGSSRSRTYDVSNVTGLQPAAIATMRIGPN